MSEVELKIKSTNIVKVTDSVEAMITQLEKLIKVEGDTGKSGEGLTKKQKQVEGALKSSGEAAERSRAMLQLQKKGLDETSQAYAQEKAAILTKIQASKKGIATSSDEYKALLKNITLREKAIATSKKMVAAQKAAEKQKKKAASSEKELGGNTKKFTRYLEDATKQVQLIDGPLGGVASRMTALSGILKNGNLALAAMGLGVGLFFHQLSSGVGVAMDAEVTMKTLEAQVTATGGAAGRTAEELDLMARSMAFATLNNSQGMREIITTMLSFKAISGQAFGQAVTLSQDMGIAMHQNPISAAKTLGKVLENPIENYRQLKRSGIEFSKEEKERMRDAQQAGKIYEAQAVVLEKLEDRFKGVAIAQADTLAGDIDTFGQKWEEYWEGLGEKLLPALREAVQLGSDVVDKANELTFSRAELSVRDWKLSLEGAVDTFDDVETQLNKVIAAQRKAAEEQAAFDKKLSEDSFFTNRGSHANIMESKRLKEQNELLELQMTWLHELLREREKMTKEEGKLTEAQEIALENIEIQVAQQKQLTQAFLESRTTRSKLYRDTKVQVDTEIALKKLNLDIDSEAGQQMKESIQTLSDFTEARIRHNTAIQKQKSLQSKQEGLQKELQLMEFVESGVRKNSEEYILAAAAIDARNSALRAGFEVGSEEYNMILRETEALGLLQAEIQKAKDMADSGVYINMFGNEQSTGDQGANFEKMLADIDQLRSLDLENEELYQQKLQEIHDTYAEITRSKQEEVGITSDGEGNEALMESEEAVFMEKEERLKELEIARRDGFITDETVYLERKNQLIREYDQKAIDAKAAQYEKSAEHKRNMNAMELADNIKSGLDNLASVKKGNKALAVAAKAAAIFKASVSFVDGLSAANALPYPANIMAYGKAFLQGTQLVQQAGSLTAPSYAFGGVDIAGEGTGRSDSIRANIAKGESVITAPATARHKETLKRMNAGLPIGSGGGGGNNMSMSIHIAGDASEQTVGLIEEKLRGFETRVAQISQQVSVNSIQEENEIGGIMNPL